MAFGNRGRTLSQDSLSGTERMGRLGKQVMKKSIDTNEAREAGLVYSPCLSPSWDSSWPVGFHSGRGEDSSPFPLHTPACCHLTNKESGRGCS